MANSSDGDVLADGMMSVAEAMAFTRLGRTEIYKRMTDGSLPFARIGKRRLIPKRAVVELLRGGLVGRGNAAK
jgi:excisionase family DNA binding protein